MEQNSFLQLFLRYPSLLMLCVATGLMMLGQGVLSPVLPLYARSFHVSTANVGLAISAFGLARLLFNIPVGMASDRMGRRVVLVAGPLVTAVGSFLSATAGDVWQLMVWRFIAGAGSAMYMTGAAAYITDISDPTNRARMLSLNQGSLLAGTSLGPAVGGLVAELGGLRSPFYVVGVVSALCSFWALTSVPETRTFEARRSERTSGREKRAGGGRGEMLALIVNLQFLLISLVGFSTFFTRTGGRQTIVPLLGADRLDLSPGSLGLIFMLMSLLNLAAVPISGSLADRWGRKAVILPSAITSSLALVMFALAGDIWFFVFASVVHGVGSGMGGPAPAAYVADISPPGSYGLAMGLYRTYGDLGFVVAPPLLGWIADASGYDGALYFDAALVLGSALVFTAFAKETFRRGRPVEAVMAPPGSEPSPGA